MIKKATEFLKENLFCDCKVKFEDSKFSKIDNVIFGLNNKKNLLYSFMIPGTTLGLPEVPTRVMSGIGDAYTSQVKTGIGEAYTMATEAAKEVSKQDVGFWEGIKQNLETIANFFNYLMHPGKLLLLVWNWTVEISFMLCVLYCIFAVFMYLGGSKKFTKYIPGTVIIYTLIQFINMFIVG